MAKSKINKTRKNINQFHKCSSISTVDNYFKYILEYVSPRERKALKRNKIRSLKEFLSLKEDDQKRPAIAPPYTSNKIFQVQEAVNIIINSNDSQFVFFEKKDFLQNLGKVISTIIKKDKQEKELICKEARLTLYLLNLDLTPPPWSLIQKTIPDIIGLKDEEIDILWTKTADLLIRDIGILKEDLDRLESNTIYDDDPLSMLLASSIGYLQRLKLSADSYEIIINYIQNTYISRNADISTPNIIPNGSAIISLEEIEPIKNFMIDSFNIHEDLMCKIHPLNVLTWTDIQKFTEKQLVVMFGLCWHSLSLINSLWHMRVYAYKGIFELSDSTLVFHKSFSEMINSFIKIILSSCESEREIELTEVILKGRLGLLDNRIWTLEELAQKTNLTRERIRQRFYDKIEKHTYLLKALYMVIKEELRACGGVCILEDLANTITLRMDWGGDVNLKVFSSFILIYEDLKFDRETGLVLDSNCKCLKCTISSSFINDFFSKEVRELSIPCAVDLLRSYCEKSACCNKRPIPLFSKSFIFFIAEMMPGYIVENGFILQKGAWWGRKGSRAQMVEEILKDSKQAMHFSNVYLMLKKSRPDDGNISERAVYSWLAKNENLILWERGTFIHKDFVNPQNELMKKIIIWIEKKLKNTGFPFLCASGALSAFSEELNRASINSEYALYSCLKTVEQDNLSFPRFPRIILKDVELLPVSIALEQFILEAGGLVNSKEIVSYGKNDLFISYVSQRIKGIPNILRTGNGIYIHRQNLPRPKKSMDNIFQYIINNINSTVYVSVEKVFKDKIITCLSAGVDSPEMLYAVLESSSLPIGMPRYPLISKPDSAEQNQSVRSLIDDWVRNLKRLCSFEELEDYFVEKLGCNSGNLFNFNSKREVLRYTRGSVIHIDTLEWGADKQLLLEMIAIDLLKNAASCGRKYSLISCLVEESSLPRLSAGIVWTNTLLAELLEREGKFIILGNAHNLFVENNNKEGIFTIEDLFFEVLSERYGGAATLDKFTEDMRNEGIILKSIKPSMLGEQKRVCLSNSLIMLKGLSGSHA